MYISWGHLFMLIAQKSTCMVVVLVVFMRTTLRRRTMMNLTDPSRIRSLGNEASRSHRRKTTTTSRTHLRFDMQTTVMIRPTSRHPFVNTTFCGCTLLFVSV